MGLGWNVEVIFSLTCSCSCLIALTSHLTSQPQQFETFKRSFCGDHSLNLMAIALVEFRVLRH